MISEPRSAFARASWREICSTLAIAFFVSRSSKRCTPSGFCLPSPCKTVFPTARQTFGDDTTCTLVNLPSRAISSPKRDTAPAAHTTSYAPLDAFTFIRRALIWVLSTLARVTRPRLALLRHWSQLESRPARSSAWVRASRNPMQIDRSSLPRQQPRTHRSYRFPLFSLSMLPSTHHNLRESPAARGSIRSSWSHFHSELSAQTACAGPYSVKARHYN